MEAVAFAVLDPDAAMACATLVDVKEDGSARRARAVAARSSRCRAKTAARTARPVGGTDEPVMYAMDERYENLSWSSNHVGLTLMRPKSAGGDTTRT
jgi:hypothetical protein